MSDVSSEGCVTIQSRKGIRRVENKERGSGSRVPGRRAECWEGGDGEMGDGGI